MGPDRLATLAVCLSHAGVTDPVSKAFSWVWTTLNAGPHICIACAFTQSPSLQPQVQDFLFDSLDFFFYFCYCPQTTLWFVYFYYSWEELFLKGREQMYFRGVMLIATKIVINCSVAFYNKQEQSYIFEIRSHLLSFDVENNVAWYINKIKK